MNILINYDYLNAVKNVNEKYTPFKVIRNNKENWAKINIPVFYAVDLLITNFNVKSSLYLLGYQFILLTTGYYILHSATKPDIYAVKSELALRQLAKDFRSANIDTSFELMKKSQIYDKKYEVKLNEKKLPELIQSKYILVPTYDHLGDVKNTSVLQEHVMGSNEYVLSLGTPKKVLKPAISSI